MKGPLSRISKDRLEQIIGRNIFLWRVYARVARQEMIPPNTLQWVDKPEDGPDDLPDRKRSFKGVDPDYEALAREQKELGDAGEELVLQWEIEFLKQHGLHDKLDQVKVVKDGEGYDVRSFDKNGNDKFIEVKTTTGEKKSRFFLTENELAFMRLNKGKYCIYRVFLYDEEFNSGKCFSITGDVESQLLMKPTQYRVAVKKVRK